MHLIKMGQCQFTDPFGWTVQPAKKTLRLFPPKAGSRRPQGQKIITQPQGEEKDCEARPPRSPLLRRKGGAIFSISSLSAQDPNPELQEKLLLDESSW